MSIGAITKVFATCPEEKSEYLVLIAMADQANDDGRDIWFKWETIAHKARIDPRTAQLPIVMISADDASLRDAARDAGVSLLLGKPYPEDELIAYLASTRDSTDPA